MTLSLPSIKCGRLAFESVIKNLCYSFLGGNLRSNGTRRDKWSKFMGSCCCIYGLIDMADCHFHGMKGFFYTFYAIMARDTHLHFIRSNFPAR